MNCSRTLVVFVSAVLVFLLGISPALGAISADWTGLGGDTNFQTGGNWSTDPTAPVAFDDTANFNTSAVTAYTVTFNGDVTNAECYVKDDTLTFDLTDGAGGGRTYSLTDKLYIGGDGAAAQLVIENGTVASTIPYASGMAELYGYDGTGTLIVRNGGTYTATSAISWVAYGVGDTGTFTVDGTGSASIGGLWGRAGTSYINVTNGGSLTLGGSLYSDYVGGAGTVGTITIDGLGSTLTGGAVVIGNTRTGILKIQNDATASIAGLTVGGGASANGLVEVGVTGTGSISSSGGFGIGSGGTGVLHVGADGTITKGGGFDHVYGGGTVMIDAGGLWTSVSFEVHAGGTATINGTLDCFSSYEIEMAGTLEGSGTVNIGNSAAQLLNTGIIRPGSSIGTLTLTGGGDVAGGDAAMDNTGGTLELEFDAASCDLIQLTTAGRSIDLDGAALVFIGSGLTGSETGHYDFLTADTITGFGDVASNDIDTVMDGLGFASGTWDLDVVGTAGSGQQLHLTYAPEPATMVMLCAGGALMLLKRRRSRRAR